MEITLVYIATASIVASNFQKPAPWRLGCAERLIIGLGWQTKVSENSSFLAYTSSTNFHSCCIYSVVHGDTSFCKSVCVTVGCCILCTENCTGVWAASLISVPPVICWENIRHPKQTYLKFSFEKKNQPEKFSLQHNICIRATWKTSENIHGRLWEETDHMADKWWNIWNGTHSIWNEATIDLSPHW